jgi:phospholipid/cholesterol/gamma-HCH transport system permease protein
MEVGEEIDALKTMGMNPVRFLVVPKMLAMMIMLPCLTMWADLMGIFGGATFAYSQIDMSFKRYMTGTIDALLLHDVITGLIKSVVFAVIITTIGCHEGFKVKGGAEGVGRSTTSSVVTSMFVVILADMIFTAIFFFLE